MLFFRYLCRFLLRLRLGFAGEVALVARRLDLVFVVDLLERVHVVLRPPRRHHLVLLQESFRQPQRRRRLELVPLHCLREDVLHFALGHRIDLGLEILSQAERLDLQPLALTDQIIDLFHASQSDLLSALFR